MKYDTIEKRIIKINPMYKSAIDEYYNICKKYSMNELSKDYSGNENNLLIILYYKILVKVYKECENIGRFNNFDDIVSSVTIKVTEYILARTSVLNCSSIISRYVSLVLSDYIIKTEENKDNISLYSCTNVYSNDLSLEELTCKNDIIEYMYHIIDTNLGSRESQILYRILEGDTLNNIQENYKVSYNRILQIKAKAYRKLSKKLHRYLKDSSIKENKIHTSSGITFGSFDETLKSIKNAKWIMYLKNLNEIHFTIDADSDRNILNDSILVGKLCLICFEDKSPELYHWYKRIKYNSSLYDIYKIFKKFINANYYTGAIRFKDKNINDPLWIMITLFYGFYSAVEFAVEVGSALSGYQLFMDLYGTHLDPGCILNGLYNSNKYSLINYISEAMKSYKYMITNFANTKFAYDDPFVLYLFRTKYFDKYKKYEKITHYSVIEKESDIKYIRDDIAPEFITITYSFLLNLLDDNIHQKYRKTIVNFLAKNYIINEAEKQEYLNER